MLRVTGPTKSIQKIFNRSKQEKEIYIIDLIILKSSLRDYLYNYLFTVQSYIYIGFLLFQPPIVILNVVVIEAENLEAKDANGM